MLRKTFAPRTRQVLAYLLVTVAFAYTIHGLHANIADLRAERAERTDQSCEISERAQKEEILDLNGTYEYLLALNSEQLGEPLNVFIIRNLPRTEEDAKLDNAPPFCDKPNIGLPEPDLKVPERPAQIDNIVKGVDK